MRLFLKKTMRKPFFRFLLLGIWSYTSKVALTALFVDFAKLNPLIGYALVLFIVIIINYLLNFYIVFRNKQGHKKKFIQYVLTTGTLMLVDYFLVNTLIYAKIHYAIAIFIVSIIIMLIKFFIFHKIVFTE